MLESVAIEMLHIHNGDSTAGTARKANVPGEHLSWREALVCGPTPRGLSADEFSRIRAKHLSEADFKALFPAFGKREPLYGFGDAQVFLELKRLGNGPHPLLTINDGNLTVMDSGQLLRTSFQITDQGKAVFNGDEDSVRLNGIDLWLGGVHLQGNEAAWRWDEDHQRLDRVEAGA